MSITKIAKLAGVSIATVSNALKGTGRVSPATAKKIKAIAKKENYTVRAKKTAAPRETKQVTFVLADHKTHLRHLSFNMRIFEGVQEKCDRLGYTVVLHSHASRTDLVKQSQGSVGVLILGHIPQPQTLIDAARKPVVWVSRYETGSADAVLENNREIARLAAAHLIARGHKSIGYIDDQYIGTVSDRGYYFERFLREAGVKPVIFRDTILFDLLGNDPIINTDKLYRILTKMFSGKDKPTALFSPGDSMTLSMYSFFKQHGIRPLKDIDIVSCNNEMPYIAEIRPRPPTIDFNLREMGVRAVESLLWRISNPSRPAQKILVEPFLVLP
ncbi:MAG: LacI family transcriptional regulator [Planctomycetaceae bacterium]|nr:LacI family transcriptional regulator [Planctomycetaceae bacterium]